MSNPTVELLQKEIEFLRAAIRDHLEFEKRNFSTAVYHGDRAKEMEKQVESYEAALRLLGSTD